jgi:hypothetical protein
MATTTTKKTTKPLTRDEMRVAICQDVLALLSAKDRKIKVGNGAYLTGDLPAGRDTTQAAKKVRSCQVCALGAMFIAEVDRNNHMTLGDLRKVNFSAHAGDEPTSLDLDKPDAIRRLRKFFGEDELAAIEAVFEGWQTRWRNWHDESRVTPNLTKVGLSALEKGPRLRAIMRAIIADGGKVLADPVSP